MAYTQPITRVMGKCMQRWRRKMADRGVVSQVGMVRRKVGMAICGRLWRIESFDWSFENSSMPRWDWSK